MDPVLKILDFLWNFKNISKKIQKNPHLKNTKKKNVLFSCIRQNFKGFSCIFSTKQNHILSCKMNIVTSL